MHKCMGTTGVDVRTCEYMDLWVSGCEIMGVRVCACMVTSQNLAQLWVTLIRTDKRNDRRKCHFSVCGDLGPATTPCR